MLESGAHRRTSQTPRASLSVHRKAGEGERRRRPVKRLPTFGPKMAHLIYMFKALGEQPAAKVNISAALVFPKRFSGTLNILTKLSSTPASRVAASDLMAKCVYSGSNGPFRLLLLCKHQCHFGCS